MVFGEDAVICISYGGGGEYVMRRCSVPFRLFCVNANIGDEWWWGSDLSVPKFRKGQAVVGVGGRPVSGVKVKWHG